VSVIPTIFIIFIDYSPAIISSEARRDARATHIPAKNGIKEWVHKSAAKRWPEEHSKSIPEFSIWTLLPSTGYRNRRPGNPEKI